MIIKQKENIREFIKNKKKQLSISEKESQENIIFTKIEQLAIFKNSKIVLLYWSLNNEVNTHNFIKKWCKHKQILLPVINGDNLIIKIFTSEKNMINSLLGTKEPLGESFTNLNKIDLTIIPGIAFDKNNNRLGRGGGYYDKLLNSINSYKIGICFDFQILNTIPTEKHDLKMDKIITV